MRAAPASFLADDLGPLLDDEPEVLVVGAGPVGLFAALRLTQLGIRAQILDEERRPAARSYALALHPLSLRLLREAGVLEPLLERGHRIDGISFYEGTSRRARVSFSELEAEHPQILVVPQQTLEGILESRLSELGIEVQWSHRLTELRQTGGDTIARIAKVAPGPAAHRAAGETFTFHPDFVIGADGHRSTVRRTLGIGAPETGPAELYAVFEFIADGPSVSADEARVVLDETGAGVLWPLGGGRMRWSFEIDQWEGFVEPRFKSRRFGEIGEEPFPYLISSKLTELLAERAPWFEREVGETGIGEVVWSAAVRFERRLADRFGRGNVWLAGDAAHLASPIGAHSMNVGLREAHELAWRLERILRGEASVDILERYDRERTREWHRLLGLADLPYPGPEANGWVRAHAGRILSCLPASGEHLESLLGQLGLELPSGGSVS